MDLLHPSPPRKPQRAPLSRATGTTSQSARRCTACLRCRRSCPRNLPGKRWAGRHPGKADATG
ncbi:4Fe-4S dicluster domain-containing protein [Burkholderia sp. MBR-1]|uniref:4Fe-4S dicluster domain-containing protein n=1 Tax=Burkholderia sp. MBR-1 TaxID=2732364 RepID=UPI0015EF491B|nr:hypothetical protein MBR110_26280 [Burkholderia sp. MBR-1]